ncbi:MAG: hypothetical protein D5S00_03180 [Tindallia sp. MSAO_Bac2]|nr:MAG: hypothetical protein D5S00_03180 [Tindallia sp. MSAO_Bac2]
MERIVYDLEFNTAFKIDRKTRQLKKGNAHPDCPQEIIEIGAAKVDEQLRIIDTFQLMVKPVLYPRMHPTIKQKTKITSEILDTGVPFPEAINLFLDWMGRKEKMLCSWGIDDYNELKRNCEYHDIGMDWASNRCDVQKMCMQHFGSPKGQQVGLKKAVIHFGVEMDERFHSALNDAVYTAKILEALKNQRQQDEEGGGERGEKTV